MSVTHNILAFVTKQQTKLCCLPHKILSASKRCSHVLALSDSLIVILLQLLLLVILTIYVTLLLLSTASNVCQNLVFNVPKMYPIVILCSTNHHINQEGCSNSTVPLRVYTLYL